MSIRCWDELVKYGALDIIHREYGAYVAPSAEPGYNITLSFDVSSLPQGGKLLLVTETTLITHHYGRSI